MKLQEHQIVASIAAAARGDDGGGGGGDDAGRSTSEKRRATAGFYVLWWFCVPLASVLSQSHSLPPTRMRRVASAIISHRNTRTHPRRHTLAQEKKRPENNATIIMRSHFRVPPAVDQATNWLSSVCRLPKRQCVCHEKGANAQHPAPELILYEHEASPYCRRVREDTVRPRTTCAHQAMPARDVTARGRLLSACSAQA